VNRSFFLGFFALGPYLTLRRCESEFPHVAPIILCAVQGKTHSIETPHLLPTILPPKGHMIMVITDDRVLREQDEGCSPPRWTDGRYQPEAAAPDGWVLRVLESKIPAVLALASALYLFYFGFTAGEFADLGGLGGSDAGGSHHVAQGSA
jgi:hypothetical protein